MAISYKIWSSCMDGCSCSLCSTLEGAALPVDESFFVAGRYVSAPPLHEGCRCSLLFVGDVAPAPVRDLEAFCAFSSITNESADFYTAINGFNSAVFFMRRLAAYPDSELAAAGLKSSGAFRSDLNDLIGSRDALVGEAIRRAYGRVLREAASLKTERGKRARLNRFAQLLRSSHELSPADDQLLASLIGEVSV